MPTQSSIPNLESQIGNLQSSADATKASISSDYGGESPSPSAISRQQSLFNIQNKITKLNDQRLRQKWYPTTTGDTTTEPTAPPEGIVGKALDVISIPLYGVVGAARHAVGQGTTGSLGGDVMENIQKSKKTFGSMLSEAGVNGPVSAVAGFGLDVMFDPVNWMTMGTSALIPKVARGIIGGAAEEGAMGALRGARAAATVRGAEVAGTLGKWSPGAFGLGTKIIDKIPLVAKDPSLEGMTWTQIGKNTLRGLAEKNVAATAEYERLTGDTMAKRLAQRGFGVGEYRFSPGDWTAAFMLSHPDSNATKFLDAWKYKTSEYVAQARRTDVIQKAVSPEALRAIQAAKNGEPIESVTMTEALKNLPAQIDVAVKQLSELPSGPSTEVKTIAQKYFGWEPSRYVKEIDDTAEILKAYNLEYTPDWQSKLNRFIVDIGEEQNRKIASLIDERGITRGAVPDSVFSEAESARVGEIKDGREYRMIGVPVNFWD